MANEARPKFTLLGAVLLVGVLLAVAFLAQSRYRPQELGPEVAAPAAPPPGETQRPEWEATPPAKPTESVPAEPKSEAPARATLATVPGGGLEAHERLGGHTLSRHVGKTADDLRARLAREPNISAASSFSDRATAEAALAAALSAQGGEIRRWLNSREDRYELRGFTWLKPVGISLRRGAGEAQEVRSLRAILQRRSSAPLGYFILTAYPQP